MRFSCFSGRPAQAGPAAGARHASSRRTMPSRPGLRSTLLIGMGAALAAGLLSLTSATTAAASTPAAVPGYASVTPTRVLDTRVGLGTPKGMLVGGHALSAKVTGVGGVPASGVGAVVLNLTAVSGTATSYLSVYRSGIARPVASTLSFLAGQTAANMVIATPGTDGKVAIFNMAGSVHVVADVTGWFTTGSAYTGLTSARILDTRYGVGARTGVVPGGHTVDLQVTGRGGVPATGAVAVALNVTAVGATAATYVRVFPTGSTMPKPANLNLPAGRPVAVLVIANLGSGGKVTFYNSAGNVHLVAEVTGWFATWHGYHPIAPARTLDTRTTGAPAGSGNQTVQYQGVGGVPYGWNVSAVVVSVTAVNPTGTGYFTLYGNAQPQPHVTSVSFAKGVTVSNLVVVRVGPGGWGLVYSSNTTNIVIDIVGYLAVDEGPWRSVSVQGDGSCGVRTDRTLWCWGNTITTIYPYPGPQGSVNTWDSVTAAGSGESECALRTDRTLWCWGYNSSGELGIGTKNLANPPTQVAAGTTWSNVSTESQHSCGVHTDGTLWCWGSNAYGMLGTADGLDHLSPTQVGTDTWKTVSAGTAHTCAVRTDGTLWCWGAASYLGILATADQPSPVQVGAATWATVSAGRGRTCAIDTDQALYCWDNNGAAPVQVATAISAVAVGMSDSCAVGTDHSLWCWGINDFGQLGLGDTAARSHPTQLAGTTWTSVAMGQSHTCALQTDGSAWCWGYNGMGDLGVRDTKDHYLPTRVA